MVIVIERYLRGISGPARTGLLVGIGACTWGFALVALAAGWKVGLAWLVLTSIALSIVRSRVRPATALPIEDAEAEALSAQDRIMKRLADMKSESETLSDAGEMTPNDAG